MQENSPSSEKISRRKMLSMLGSTAGIVLGVPIFGPSIFIKGKEFFDRENLLKREIELVNEIKRISGIRIDLGALDERRMKEFADKGYVVSPEESIITRSIILEKILTQLYLYPEGFLKTYVISVDLSNKIQKIVGDAVKVYSGLFTIHNKNITLAIDTKNESRKSWYEKSRVWENMKTFYNLSEHSDFTRVMHHEIAHAFTLSRTHELSIELDTKKPFLEFVQEEVKEDLEFFSVLVDRAKAQKSITTYAKTSPEEEVAEIISYMFTDMKVVDKYAASGILELGKVKVLKKYLLKISGGAFNEKYWQDLRQGKVGVGYFGYDKVV